jgi:hypothetical protein
MTGRRNNMSMRLEAAAFRQGDQLSSFENYQRTFAIPIKRRFRMPVRIAWTLYY